MLHYLCPAGFDTSQRMDRSVVPIGRPIDNVKMYVLDSKMQPLPVGVPGELMISSHQVARGYLKRPEENAKTFVDNPYGSGDYARMYRTGDRELLPACLDQNAVASLLLLMTYYIVELLELGSWTSRLP